MRHTRRPLAAAGVVMDQPVGQVTVVRAAGPLRTVLATLDLTVRQALADEPRGVVCDLADVSDCADPDSLRTLATLGVHPQDWPAVPVAVVLPDPPLRDRLRTEPPGDHLVVARSRRLALEQVVRARAATTRSLALSPQPTAPREARRFVSDVLLDADLDVQIPAASVVVSELVTNAVLHARTDIELSVAVSDERCRISVRDRDPCLPLRVTSPATMHGRGMLIVDQLASAHGVLPRAAGGKVVWAVLADDALEPVETSVAQPSVPV